MLPLWLCLGAYFSWKSLPSWGSLLFIGVWYLSVQKDKLAHFASCSASSQLSAHPCKEVGVILERRSQKVLLISFHMAHSCCKLCLSSPHEAIFAVKCTECEHVHYCWTSGALFVKAAFVKELHEAGQRESASCFFFLFITKAPLSHYWPVADSQRSSVM